MTVLGITRVKDEVDIIGPVLDHMLTQVDSIIVVDNGSTDGTKEIVESKAVTLRLDPDPAYYQSERMTELAHEAAERGATWVVPFDADEWWYSPFGRIADVLADCPTAIASAALYDHIATGADLDEPDPVARMGWRRVDAGAMPKVACRARLNVSIHQGNHGADYGRTGVTDGLLIVRHFPYRSVDQFISKSRNGAAAYAATDLPPDIGAHWRGYGAILETHGPEALGDVFRQWFWSADPTTDPTLIFDPVAVGV